MECGTRSAILFVNFFCLTMFDIGPKVLVVDLFDKGKGTLMKNDKKELLDALECVRAEWLRFADRSLEWSKGDPKSAALVLEAGLTSAIALCALELELRSLPESVDAATEVAT